MTGQDQFIQNLIQEANNAKTDDQLHQVAQKLHANPGILNSDKLLFDLEIATSPKLQEEVRYIINNLPAFAELQYNAVNGFNNFTDEQKKVFNPQQLATEIHEAVGLAFHQHAANLAESEDWKAFADFVEVRPYLFDLKLRELENPAKSLSIIYLENGGDPVFLTQLSQDHETMLQRSDFLGNPLNAPVVDQIQRAINRDKSAFGKGTNTKEADGKSKGIKWGKWIGWGLATGALSVTILLALFRDTTQADPATTAAYKKNSEQSTAIEKKNQTETVEAIAKAAEEGVKAAAKIGTAAVTVEETGTAADGTSENANKLQVNQNNESSETKNLTGKVTPAKTTKKPTVIVTNTATQQEELSATIETMAGRAKATIVMPGSDYLSFSKDTVAEWIYGLGKYHWATPEALQHTTTWSQIRGMAEADPENKTLQGLVAIGDAWAKYVEADIKASKTDNGRTEQRWEEGNVYNDAQKEASLAVIRDIIAKQGKSPEDTATFTNNVETFVNDNDLDARIHDSSPHLTTPPDDQIKQSAGDIMDYLNTYHPDMAQQFIADDWKDVKSSFHRPDGFAVRLSTDEIILFGKGFTEVMGGEDGEPLSDQAAAIMGKVSFANPNATVSGPRVKDVTDAAKKLTAKAALPSTSNPPQP